MNICDHFQLLYPVISCISFGAGHIHETFLVTCADGSRYTLQKVNAAVFPDIPLLMENVRKVTEHLHAKHAENTLRLIPAQDGASFVTDADDAVWRMFSFVPGICRERAETPEEFAGAGRAFGTFLRDLSDLPAGTFPEVIPDFHHTPKRVKALEEAVRSDRAGRAGLVREELAFALSRAEAYGQLIRLRDAGRLPVRLIHGDTKCSNIVLDERTGEPVCVLDLDTVMPGLAAWDVGEAVRSGANAAAEDETDLSRVTFQMAFAEAFLRAYEETCADLLTDEEKRSLPSGVKTMTYENGIRFLTDYLNGDVYFKTAYPEHNLVRARCQFRLLAEEEACLRY